MTHPDSTARVFVRAARAEFTRLVSVRSTWWCLSAAVALMLFIGGMAGADHVAGEAAPIWMPAQVALVPAQFLFVMAAMLAVTGEYASGNIASSLQWVPRRPVLLAARVTVPVLAVTVVAVLAAVLAALVAWAFVGSAAEVVVADIAASLGRVALVVWFGSVLAVGIGLVMRSTAGTLAAIFLLLMVLPLAFGNSGVAWMATVAEHLPGGIVVPLLAGKAVGSGLWMAQVTGVWVAAALLAGGWSLIHRDAM